MDDYESLSHTKWDCMWSSFPSTTGGPLRGTETVSGGGVPQAGLAEGKPDRTRSPHARSRPHDDLDSTEVCGFAGSWIYQGHERNSFGPDVRREEAQLRGTAFLGPRVLRLDRRSRRSGNTEVHQEPGARGQAPRPTQSVAPIAAFRRPTTLGSRQRPQQPL